MKTPEEWMRDFEAKIADAQAKAAAVQEGLAQAGGSAASDDGTIIVTVAPNGALTGLELSAGAMKKSHAQLSGEILEIARKAQRGAAVKVADTFAAVEGEGSETYRMITEYLPPPEEEEQPKPAGYAFNEEYEERAATAAPPPPPVRRPAPRPSADEDDDFGGDSIFKKQ
ncbi:YbaB/EbfC family nucleoid-associated protein [Lentzea sp. NBC_00516]|uniref:YbaB/EbfC family nucleoid-associated protein n=1 Tax=Lentzea sp. NBC_00516 TaxID=2903582 RepID=UPI002E8121E1|nr:YbaB/EbfC family nucleoid-associated protein [Lentzea sp. NBC_00516]WUD23982.1 YbaB/EbfC family nucleoid-associated protein [Lentzea sp. NBC_00516]